MHWKHHLVNIRPRYSKYIPLLLVELLLGVAGVWGQDQSVLTQHNDSGRTGAYLAEHILLPDRSRDPGYGFRLLYDRPIEGANSQILYVHSLNVNADGCGREPVRGTRNVMFATTDHNMVYAFDADNYEASGSLAGCIWATDLSRPGELSGPGILSTPVIDPITNRMWVVSSTGNDAYTIQQFRLASLDISAIPTGPPS